MKRVIFVFMLGIICSTAFSQANQANFNFYISNSGNDSNAGTSRLLPRKTLAATIPLLEKYALSNGSVGIGLKGGDTFNEVLISPYRVKMGTYDDAVPGIGNFAVLNGSDEFNTGWKQLNGSTTYHQE